MQIKRKQSLKSAFVIAYLCVCEGKHTSLHHVLGEHHIWVTWPCAANTDPLPSCPWSPTAARYPLTCLCDRAEKISSKHKLMQCAWVRFSSVCVWRERCPAGWHKQYSPSFLSQPQSPVRQKFWLQTVEVYLRILFIYHSSIISIIIIINLKIKLYDVKYIKRLPYIVLSCIFKNIKILLFFAATSFIINIYLKNIIESLCCSHFSSCGLHPSTTREDSIASHA